MSVDIPLSSALYIFSRFLPLCTFLLRHFLSCQRSYLICSPRHGQPTANFTTVAKSEYKKFQQIFRLSLKLLFLNCGRPNLLTDLDPRSKYGPRGPIQLANLDPLTRYLVEITTYTIGREVLDMSAYPISYISSCHKAHKALPFSFHPLRFAARVLTFAHDYHPAVFLSCSTILLHVVLGWPGLLLRHVCHRRQNCSGTGVIGNYGVAQGTGASF